MAKEQNNNNATVNNTPAQQPENQAPVNQENAQPADQQANNPAPQPEQLDPPKEGILRRIGRFFKEHKAAKYAAIGIGVAGAAAGGYAIGHFVGHSDGVMDTLSMLPDDDDAPLGIEDHGDIDVNIDDIPDIDTSTIDI